jgi:hypothetical protein
MTTTTTLTALCTEAVARLERATQLVKAIATGDIDAARRLESMADFDTYAGSCLKVNVSALLGEVEEIEADATFGPRG